jgi:hypothetical protein
MATKPTETRLDPQLLKIMQDVYARYTGQQITDVIGYIRQCIELEREQVLLQQEIERMTARLAEISK